MLTAYLLTYPDGRIRKEYCLLTITVTDLAKRTGAYAIYRRSDGAKVWENRARMPKIDFAPLGECLVAE